MDENEKDWEKVVAIYKYNKENREEELGPKKSTKGKHIQ